MDKSRNPVTPHKGVHAADYDKGGYTIEKHESQETLIHSLTSFAPNSSAILGTQIPGFFKRRVK
jgi:hypothetical protein